MKKAIISLALFASIFILSSCSSRIELPDFEGVTYIGANRVLRDKGISFYSIDIETDDPTLVGFVAGYKEHKASDKVDEEDLIGVLVYVLSSDELSYFEPIDIDYNGPYLDGKYSEVDYIDPRGGYFEVTLKSCTDGDTAKFVYPNDIYELITSYSKSVRFLNMDTEETFSGGEEEWGKPASLYTCSLLYSAEDIIIQTDPGDAATGTYGRLLGWVWIKLPDVEEFQLLNYMIVKQGLAQVKYEFGAGTTLTYGEATYNEWMHEAMDYAEDNKLGQWGNELDYYWDYENDEPNSELWN